MEIAIYKIISLILKSFVAVLEDEIAHYFIKCLKHPTLDIYSKISF
jgi:hypothetical protein